MKALASQAQTAQQRCFYHQGLPRPKRWMIASATHKNVATVIHQQPKQQQQQQHNKQTHRPLVRPVQQSDKEAWCQLFRDYIAWYKATVADDIIELTWQRLMAGGEGNHQGLVAEDSSGQVCQCVLLTTTVSSSRSSKGMVVQVLLASPAPASACICCCGRLLVQKGLMCSSL